MVEGGRSGKCLLGDGGCIGNFLLSFIFFVRWVRTAYKSAWVSVRNTSPYAQRGQENRCHLFNKLILIGKKNAAGYGGGRWGSMWSCLSIGRFYETKEQIKFSWTSQTVLTCRASGFSFLVPFRFEGFSVDSRLQNAIKCNTKTSKTFNFFFLNPCFISCFILLSFPFHTYLLVFTWNDHVED